MVQQRQHEYRKLVRACALALLLLLLAPFMQGISFISNAGSGNAVCCDCPCCRGKHGPNAACSRRAHADKTKTSGPLAAEFHASCSCAMAFPASFHNKHFTPTAGLAAFPLDARMHQAITGNTRARFSLLWRANPRRGPPYAESNC